MVTNKKKIAIIDDDFEMLDTLKSYLQNREVYDISTFLDPSKAINLVKNNHFDLILLDINMPNINGIDFLKEVKTSEVNTKVVMMTSESTLDTTIACSNYDAENYLTKPFISLRDVENKIAQLLNLR